MKRNRSRQQGYRPRYAPAPVLARLKHGWSPEQIAGRLRREAGHTVIAHETI